jgi:hypothetical protein
MFQLSSSQQLVVIPHQPRLISIQQVKFQHIKHNRQPLAATW